METKNSLSDVLKKLVVDINNMNSFLFGLDNVLSSKSENVSISQKKSDGSSTSLSVPSFGYFKGLFDQIEENKLQIDGVLTPPNTRRNSKNG